MIKRIIKYFLLLIKYRNKKVILNTNNISLKTELGKCVQIMKNTEIGGFSKIGKYSYIGKNCSITKATIGNYCSIANNVSIGQGEHDLTKISTNSIFYENAFDELTKKECIIGNDVWIGVDSIILRGGVIGNGAVIGANSVVTKDVPPYAVVVGSPARIIKYRFDDYIIEKIEQSNWFSYDFDEAKEIIDNIQKDMDQKI